MVTLRRRDPGNFSTPQDAQKMEFLGKECVSEYELSREERIKENQERMQKLGILDKLSALKSANGRGSKRRTNLGCSPLPCSEPVRRSSRLQSSTPVSYCELRQFRDGTRKEKGRIFIQEGVNPEMYTEEHEKLLGNTERVWTLFVDGYGVDGKRIYDSFKGKTCHQCRQKTLGHRTQCIQCNMVQGQFCGDCLYMRYGEHVLEANENPNWICPGCRGICNCSLCRQAKGWAPTGPLYRKISSLGYKSVAHYLIQTRQHDASRDENISIKTPASAKRSLPFSDNDAIAGDEDKNITSPTEPDDGNAADLEDGTQPSEVPLAAEQKTDLEHNEGEESYFVIENATTETIQGSGTTEIKETINASDPEHVEDKEIYLTVGDATIESIHGSGSELKNGTTSGSDCSYIVAPSAFSKTMKKRMRIEVPVDSIAGG